MSWFSIWFFWMRKFIFKLKLRPTNCDLMRRYWHWHRVLLVIQKIISLIETRVKRTLCTHRLVSSMRTIKDKGQFITWLTSVSNMIHSMKFDTLRKTIVKVKKMNPSWRKNSEYWTDSYAVVVIIMRRMRGRVNPTRIKIKFLCG